MITRFILGYDIKGKQSENKFFTTEFFGVTLIISSFLLGICLLFGGNVLYNIGTEVQYFLLGVFGYLSYPILLVVNAVGFMLFLGKKPTNKSAVKPILILCLFLVALLCLLNVATIKFTANNYKEYLYNAFLSGRSGLEGVCAGGVLISLITYPFAKFLTKIGAIIFFAVLIALIIYCAIKFRSSIYVKISDVREYPKQQPNDFASGDINNAVTPNSIDSQNKPFNSNATAYGNGGYNNGYNNGGYASNSNRQGYDFNSPSGYQPNNFNSPSGYQPNNNGGNLNGYYPSQEDLAVANHNVERENAMRILYGTSPKTYSQTYEGSFKTEQARVINEPFNEQKQNDSDMISSPIKKEFTPQDYTVKDNSYNDVEINEVQNYQNDYEPFEDDDSDNNGFVLDDGASNSNDAVGDTASKISSFFENDNQVSNNYNDFNVNDEKPVEKTVDKTYQNPEYNDEEYSKRLIENMPINYNYNAPPISLFKTIDCTQNNYEFEVFKAEVKERILSTLARFGVETEIPRVFRGPAVTRFDIAIPPDVPMGKVTKLQNDLNLRIAAKSAIRMIAPIPNTSYVGIEVPNNVMDSVSIKDIISSDGFLNTKPFSLVFALGKDVIGNPVSLDIADMPHLLVTGTTGSGKSVCLNSLIISLMVKYGPDELRFVIVDPKRVDLEPFKDIPHMMFEEIIEDVPTTNAMLTWAVEEMESRYRELAKFRAKNIKDYNVKAKANGTKIMPRIVIVIDEFSDIMLQDKKGVGVKVCAIAQKARAAGIHLILAAQRPSVDIIEGPIKSNLPSRIVFKASSVHDSMTSLGEAGAEKLLGRGDCLYKTNGMYAVERVMGAYVSDEEMYDVIDYVCQNNPKYCDYNNWAKIKASVSASSQQYEENNLSVSTPDQDGEGKLGFDSLNVKAMRIGYDYGGLSVSFLQRKLGVGYPRAAKIIDWLTDNGYITPNAVANKRQMIMPKEEFEEKFGSNE